VAFNPNARRWLEELFGKPALGAQTMYYFKPPGRRGQGMHQDNFYLLSNRDMHRGGGLQSTRRPWKLPVGQCRTNPAVLPMTGIRGKISERRPHFLTRGVRWPPLYRMFCAALSSVCRNGKHPLNCIHTKSTHH